MSNSATLYLRLLQKIVRESAWRLGSGEETFLAAGFGGGPGRGPSVIRGGTARDVKADKNGKEERASRTECGHQLERGDSARS